MASSGIQVGTNLVTKLLLHIFRRLDWDNKHLVSRSNTKPISATPKPTAALFLSTLALSLSSAVPALTASMVTHTLIPLVIVSRATRYSATWRTRY